MTRPELELRFRTVQLEHEFGRPYQIGHHEHASKAADADLCSFYVCRGDVIVMGSDGLLDNVADRTIIDTLNKVGTNSRSRERETWRESGRGQCQLILNHSESEFTWTKPILQVVRVISCKLTIAYEQPWSSEYLLVT